MKVLDAAAMGLCFGVRDALQTAETQPDPTDVTVFGELVHNEAVLQDLRRRGYAMAPESNRTHLPATGRVMITAHGVSDSERQRLLAAGKSLIDTTCPLVERAHQAAQQLAGECDLVVVLGKPGHVEVRGITGDLERFEVVADTSAARCYFVRTLGVLCQTTFPVHRAQQVLRALRQLNPGTEIRFVDTICEPTRQRVAAMEELVKRVDAVVVVGGKASNNTAELVQLCERAGVRALHVQGTEGLDVAWFRGCDSVGLTAGTSTTDAAVHEVRQALRAMRPAAN